MLGKIFPREEKFFTMFADVARLLVEGAQEFKTLLAHPEQVEGRVQNLRDIEKKADDANHRIVALLHSTFLTPIDRTEIHQLATAMDDVIDYLDAAGQRMALYRITEIPAIAMELADLCLKSCEGILFVVAKLENMKNSPEILARCVEINRWENEADSLLRKGMAQLFDNEPDIKKLLKIKEIYDLLEMTTDRCEEVANLVEGIVLEHK